VAHLAWEHPDSLQMAPGSLDLIVGSDLIYGGPTHPHPYPTLTLTPKITLALTLVLTLALTLALTPGLQP